jgi:hypothetical protein
LRTGQVNTRFLNGDTIEQRKQFLETQIFYLDRILCSKVLPTFDHSILVYRGEFHANDGPSYIFSDPGYKSTSINPNVAFNFCQSSNKEPSKCILLQIELPAGYPIFKVPLKLSRFSESEIILSRGTTFVPMGNFVVTDKNGSKIQVIRLRAEYHCKTD